MKKLVLAFFVVFSLLAASFFRPFAHQNCVWAESGSSDYVLTYVFSELDINNAELRRLREEYAQSILDLKDAKAGYGPSIDLLVTGTYMPDPMIGKITLDVEDLSA